MSFKLSSLDSDSSDEVLITLSARSRDSIRISPANWVLVRFPGYKA